MDNRSKILACALELFASCGYDAVGVQRIVEAAEVSKPTLYHYFGSKRGVLEHLLEEFFSALFQDVESALVYTGDLPKTLSNVVAAYFKFSVENPVFYRMQLSMWFAPAHSEAFTAVLDYNLKQQALLENLFVEAVREYGNMMGRHQTYAATFLGMINTYIGISLNGYVTLNQQVTERAVHQFIHGILS